MTFDFFNTSALAFGSKLTHAFTQLNNQLAMAQSNLDSLLDDQAIFDQYLNRNYQVPIPSRPDMACRVDEAFNFIRNCYGFNDITFSEDEGLTVDVTFFNSYTDRITHATGNTELTEGYAYVREATAANKPDRTIRFSEDEGLKGNDILLFKFRIQDGYLFTTNETGYTNMVPLDFTQYTGLSCTINNPIPYTAKGYECVAVRGAQNNLNVTINGTTVAYGNGNNNHRLVFLYLKPGDVVSGSGIDTRYNLYKVKYEMK